MDFEENKSVAKFGEIIGFLFSYLLFTTILFFALRFTEKIPKWWSVLQIIPITFAIALLGLLLKRLLR